MHERLKQIRLEKKLNQAEFSKLLGMGQSTLGMLEVGKREILDRHIKTICSIFNVNENWLRTGEGEMFTETKETVLLKAAELLNLDDTEQKFLSAYLSLDETQRQNFKEFWRQMVQSYIGQNEIAATADTRPAANDGRLTRAQKEELMKQQLDLEEKMAASASTTTNGSGETA